MPHSKTIILRALGESHTSMNFVLQSATTQPPTAIDVREKLEDLPDASVSRASRNRIQRCCSVDKQQRIELKRPREEMAILRSLCEDNFNSDDCFAAKRSKLDAHDDQCRLATTSGRT